MVFGSKKQVYPINYVPCAVRMVHPLTAAWQYVSYFVSQSISDPKATTLGLVSGLTMHIILLYVNAHMLTQGIGVYDYRQECLSR